MQIVLGFCWRWKKAGVESKLMICDILNVIRVAIHQKLNFSPLSFNHFR